MGKARRRGVIVMTIQAIAAFAIILVGIGVSLKG